MPTWSLKVWVWVVTFRESSPVKNVGDKILKGPVVKYEISRVLKAEQTRAAKKRNSHVRECLGSKIRGVLTGRANGTKLRKKVKILSVYTNFS